MCRFETMSPWLRGGAKRISTDRRGRKAVCARGKMNVQWFRLGEVCTRSFNRAVSSVSPHDSFFCKSHTRYAG